MLLNTVIRIKKFFLFILKNESEFYNYIELL